MGSTSPPGSSSPPESTGDCIPLEKRTWLDVKKHAPNPDRISALPDDILIKILSLMTVREAAMTDILSPRWRHFWENINYLILDMDTFKMQVPADSDYHGNPDFWNSEATKFVNKVNGVLRHHNGSRIKKFKVSFPLSSVHASELDRWVAFAAASGPKMFILILSDHLGGVRVHTQSAERYNFPLKHYVDLRCCRFRYMILSTCSLEMVHGNLRPLKKLKIRWPKIFTPTRLRTISIAGFSGEFEMVQLVLFLLSWSPMLKGMLIDTHRHHRLGGARWVREESEDATRCNYAREVVSTHLAPNVPSTMKFTVT